jgi:hypothetical protein
VIFLNWSLTFYGTKINPSDVLSTTTVTNKIFPGNVHLSSTDDLNNNIARSRSTNLHNSFHTRHREKNRKNKQQNHYYIKNQYYPYDPLSASLPSSSSKTTSVIHQQYQIEISSSHHNQPFVTCFLIVIGMIYYIYL